MRKESRARALGILKRTVIVLNIYMVILVCLRLKNIENYYWNIILFAECCLSATVALLVTFWKPAYIDFIVLQIQVTRAISTYVLFQWVENRVFGFE